MKSSTKLISLGILALLSAVPVAYLIHVINESFPDRPETAILIIGGIFGLLLMLPVAVYLFLQRRSIMPTKLGLIIFFTTGVLLVSIYLYWVSFYVSYPADFLTWSEGDFVNDILKFRQEYPIYSAQQNNESNHYTPGSQILTYFLAWLSGNSLSIPVYRMIQIGYVLLASVIAALCCQKLVKTSLKPHLLRDRNLWWMFWLPFLFLIATNSLTNPFAHNLHNDALALLMSVLAYWLLLEYVSKQEKLVLVLMAIIPAVGFLVKQNMVIWIFLYSIQLAFFQRPRSLKRLGIFLVIAFGGLGIVVIGCYILWGGHFFYWIFYVLSSHKVSPLRSFQHVLDVWPYFFIGLFSGIALIRKKNIHHLLGPWVIWFLLILVETYTSGIAWMLNHIGPGSLIAGIWFLAGLARIWPKLAFTPNTSIRPLVWLRVGIGIGLVGLLFSGLGVVRIPIKPIPDDAYRYLREIEREFQGESAKNILIDVGTWVYMKEGVIKKDSAPSIGERGYSRTGDFSGMIQRLKQQKYSKILVRNLHSPEFWYDYWSWSKSSDIKKTLLENYREVGKIRGVDKESVGWVPSYGFDEISILLPREH